MTRPPARHACVERVLLHQRATIPSHTRCTHPAPRNMHPGLAALAGESAAADASTGMLKALLASGFARVKAVFASREEAKVMLGKLVVTGRTFLSPTAFSKPADRTEWVKRLRANLSFFRNIYLLIFLAVLVYTVLSSPLLLVGLSMLAGAWIYSFILTNQEEALTIGGFEMRRREKLIGASFVPSPTAYPQSLHLPPQRPTLRHAGRQASAFPP